MSRWFIGAVWLGLALVGLWQARYTDIATDMTLFLPRDDARTALLEELREGPAARLILLAVTGGESAAPVSKRLAEHLRASDLFVRVENGTLALPPQAQEHLFAYRYLLSPQVRPERFTVAGLQAELQKRLAELQSPLAVLQKNWLARDPTGEFTALLLAWQAHARAQPAQRQGVWLSADGELALLLAETRAPGFDLAAQAQVSAVIDAAFAAAATDKPDVRLLRSGPAVFAVLSSTTIQREAQWLSIAASLAVALMLWFAFHSLRLLLLSILPLLTALLAGVAVTSAYFGGIYGLTLAFGTTLIGLAIDYPIHVFAHLRPGAAVAESMQRIWPTLRLGVITTVLGYVAMLTGEFVGLAQLGVFAIAGLLGAAACTRWLLPTLLPAAWSPSYDLGAAARGDVLLHPARWLVWLGIALPLGLLIAAGPALRAPWQDDLAALSPVPQSLLALDRRLRTALGAPEPGQLIVLRAPDAETALQRSEALLPALQGWIDAGLLTGFDAAARYLSSQQVQRARQQALPEAAKLAANLAQAQQGLPFRAGIFEPFIAEVATARALPPLTPSDVAATPLGARVETLLFPTRSGDWLALLPLVGVADAPALRARLAAWPGAEHVDLRVESNRLVAGFRTAAFERLALGGGLIVLVLWIGLRSLKRALLALAPVLLAMITTVALLLLTGQRLTLFHLVALLLVLGVGIDYSLFFGRADDYLPERRRTLYALLLCAGSTLAVFGMLALSDLPVLRALGQTVALGVAASFVLAWLIAQRWRPSN